MTLITQGNTVRSWTLTTPETNKYFQV